MWVSPQAAHYTVRDERAGVREVGIEAILFCNLISEVMYHHFCYKILVQPCYNVRRLTQLVNTRHWYLCRLASTVYVFLTHLFVEFWENENINVWIQFIVCNYKYTAVFKSEAH